MIDTSSELAASRLPHLAHDRLLSAMRVVESLPPSARGALMIGTDADTIGTILVEANRVCWSAVPGMSGRFRDILRSHCNDTSDAELEAVFKRCRRDSQPLVDTLAMSGIVSPDHMRAAIKQHTIESLLTVDATVASLCGSRALEWPMEWIEHRGPGYNPRYTFGAVEVLEAAGAQRLDELEAELMFDHLEAVAAPSNAVIALSFQPDGTPNFIGAPSELAIDLDDLIDLTTWADAALGASAGFSPQVAHACSRSADGGAVAWRYQGQCCVALCMDRASLQRLTATLGNQSLAMVLATRTAVLDRVRERTGNSNKESCNGDC
ncbi:MAG TPA: hypothetical protein VJV78_34810 [Polyangiales bacterium]|nr:hypothetical protein [Polyangiales bacterium]